MVSVDGDRLGLERESSPIPARKGVHRPVEGLTMQELLRTAAKHTSSSSWAESVQPLANFESNIASRISLQTHEAREGACQARAVHPVSPPRFQSNQSAWSEAEFRERERLPPKIWSEAAQPSQQSFQNFSNLANLGPAANDLALMIQNSQRVQYYVEQGANPRDAALAAQDEVARYSMVHANPNRSLSELQQLQYRQPSWEGGLGLQAHMRPFAAQLSHLQPADGRWGPRGPAPRPQARAFDVYQPPAQLSEAAHTELIRSLQMLQEAQRLSALASSQIQEAYESAGQGSNRKRKLSEASNALTQQIGQVLAEGEDLAQKPAAQGSQICSLCGATSTPVWRRLNKALVCNACGLKRRRSAKVSCMPKTPTLPEEALESAPPPILATAPATLPPGGGLQMELKEDEVPAERLGI